MRISTILATSVVLTACNTNGTQSTAKSEVQNQWAVDMKKVPGAYGGTTSTFFGASHLEAGLPDLEAMGMGDAGAQLNQAMIWDQAFKKSLGDKGQGTAVILENGTQLDPKSATGEDLYVNIVPMFRDTDPTDQTAIKAMMQDGDVIVYFHPEFDDKKDYMERRASHVAMHYEYTNPETGKELVHHIDNPNNYGPAYNHRPTKHMPFHVFRFQPDADKTFTTGSGEAFQIGAQAANVYGKTARNWAFITNDQSPFADFFTLNLTNRGDLDQFAQNALNGLDIPSVYCSGLAYANLNLALNYPLNSEGLGDLYSAFEQGSYDFSDAGRAFTINELSDAVDTPIKPGNELIFAPYGASDMINVWVETYMGHIPDEVKQGIFADPDFQQGMVGALSQLEWSDSAPGAFSSAKYSPANDKNIGRWAGAFGQPADALDAYLNGDHEAYGGDGDHEAPYEQFEQRYGEDGPSLLEALDYLLNVKDVSIELDGRTPMAVLKDIEAHMIENRFVPPRIWMDQGDTDNANMVYVGTVVNCEILSPADGSEGDACAAGGGGGSKTFKEGAADTQTYPHYAVQNGAEKTHRRFDATPGPEDMSFESTTVSFRATASAIQDVVFIAHTPTDWADAEVPQNVKDMSMYEYDAFCTEENATGRSCVPQTGIAFKAEDTGQALDETYTFSFSEVCEEIEDNAYLCNTAYRTSDGTWDFSSDGMIYSSGSRGLWAATMVDVGADTTEAPQLDPENCQACQNGGAHFNQWVLNIEGTGTTHAVPSGADTGIPQDHDPMARSCLADNGEGGNFCGEGYDERYACQCDSECLDSDDCCSDYEQCPGD